ncbi:MAG: peptidyl-prolyl cis-trans isomerase [Rhodovarius sp.]|nr:peptidyl-prolyl cis-trans isomerase [Rhodovarius sp.]
MLMTLRALAGTWVAKALFVLLILSFAAWGIEDMLRNLGRESTLARIDGQPPIELSEAQERLRRELQRLQRATEGRLEPDAALRTALAERVVEGLITERAVAREAARLGLRVPDAALRDFVWSIPGFQGADGRFSRLAFDSFLRQNELTEARLLALLRADLARQQMTHAVRAGASLPAEVASRLLAWQLERRSVALVELRIADAPEPPAPTESEIERFHENNPDRFSSPERREVAIALLNAAILMPQIEVEERELAEAYAAARARFEVPERRRLLQALLPEEEAARRIAELWVSTTDDAAVEAAVRAAGGTWTDLGRIARDELPLPALAEVAFALDPNGVSTPVRTGFGWHVLHVTEIEPALTRSLQEVREELRAEIAAERAADAALARLPRIQDALAAGTPLPEIAQRYGMLLIEGRIDASGRDESGRELAMPLPAPARRSLLREVFQTPAGAPARLHEGDYGFAAIEVRAVAPAALRPLAEVREAVIVALREERRRRFQEERAAALLAAARGGQRLAEAAAAAGLAVETLGPFPRQAGPANPIPREFLGPIFALRPGEVTMIPGPVSFAVVELLSITPADLASEGEALAALRAEGAAAMADDLEQQYLAALRARAEVRINPRLLRQLAAE